MRFLFLSLHSISLSITKLLYSNSPLSPSSYLAHFYLGMVIPNKSLLGLLCHINSAFSLILLLLLLPRDVPLSRSPCKCTVLLLLLLLWDLDGKLFDHARSYHPIISKHAKWIEDSTRLIAPSTAVSLQHIPFQFSSSSIDSVVVVVIRVGREYLPEKA